MKLIELRMTVCPACDQQGQVLKNFHEVVHEVLDVSKSARAQQLAQACMVQTTPTLVFVDANDKPIYAEPGFHDLKGILKMYEIARKLC